MAEASTSGSRRVLCRYFANGVCRFGRDCHNSHDRESSAVDNRCRYYMAGNCAYGSRCRYEHVRPTATSQESQSPTSNATSSPSSTTHSHHPSGARAKQRQKLNLGANSSLNCNAKEYKPQNDSYRAVLSGVKDMCMSSTERKDYGELCPYTQQGECPFQGSCHYVHGDPCELCGKPCLHPSDQSQRRAHQAECMKVLEDDMQLSFAISRSSDKACGICMETVMEKSNLKERQFGILTGCNHIFCLSCIREWRGRKEYKRNVVRACPECRVHSDFIVPSTYWHEDDKEKEKFIADYKSKLSKKACKYFDEGRGKCPFGSACFYLHAYPDGRVATNEEPPKPKPRRVRTAANTFRAIQESLLWDFLEERESQGALSSVIDLDEDFIIQLLSSVGDVDSDDTYSEISDEYFDSDWTDDDDEESNQIRFGLL